MNQKSKSMSFGKSDYLVMLGLGIIIAVFMPNIQRFWAQEPVPPANVVTVIPLKTMVTTLSNHWYEPAAFFFGVAFVIYLGISGNGRLLRAVRLSCFIAIALCILFNAHINLRAPEGFEIDLFKSLWICQLVPMAAMFIFNLISILWSTKDAIASILPLLCAIEFTVISLIGGTVMQWYEIMIFGSIGAIASLMSAPFEVPKDFKRPFEAEVALIGVLLAFLMYTGIGLFCWLFLLAKWNPQFCWC